MREASIFSSDSGLETFSQHVELFLSASCCLGLMFSVLCLLAEQMK